MVVFETRDEIATGLMRQALLEAARCTPVATAFCVGCVLVDPATGHVLSTGYSRELDGNTHAEANALDKLDPALAVGAHLYTTLEPCSVRLSGNVPCTRRVIEAGIAQVFLGVQEPADFVACEGVRLLREAGIEVWVVLGLEAECLAEARRGH